MAGYLQILGTNTGDSAPCVYFFTDHASYLFNCGEGTQRVCVGNRIRLARLQAVFLTRLDAQTLGGLPGMSLTLAEIGLSNLRLYGPLSLDEFSRGMQTFYRPGRVDTGCDLCHNSGVVQNRQCEKCAEMFKQQRAEQVATNTDVPQRGNLNLTPVLCLSTAEYTHLDSNLKVSSALIEVPGNVKQVVCYVVQTHPMPGKFDEKKSKALGIKSNDSRKGELAGGRSAEIEVKNDRGVLEKRMVHPSEVVGDPTCGLAFAIIDCPTIEYITPLVNHSLLQSFQPSFPTNIDSGKSEVVVPAMRPLVNQTYLPEKEPARESLWRQVGRATHLELMVHMAPFEVVCQPDYKQWMASFGPIKHVMLNASQSRQEHIFHGALGLQQQLRGVKPEVFPSLAWNTLDPCADLKDVPLVNPHIANFDFPHPNSLVEGALLWKYVLIPRTKARIDTSNMLPHIETISSPLSSLRPPSPPALVAKRKRVELAEAQKKKKNEEKKRRVPRSETASSSSFSDSPPMPSLLSSSLLHESVSPSLGSTDLLIPNTNITDSTSTIAPLSIHFGEQKAFPTPGLAAIGNMAEESVLMFLGTGSAMPSKYRNVTGIYFNPSDGSNGGMLLDCGEGTFGQLCRMRGVSEVRRMVANLACVWISHMHADHHLGLVKIVEEFAEQWQGTERLLIIGPDKLQTWLKSFGAATHNSKWTSCYWCVTCEELGGSSEAAAYLRQRVGAALVNVPVLHCHDAWGLVIAHQSGYKVVYSGDTEYCPALVEAGRGATVLIHEATMGPSMEQQAAEKRHSTITDAVRAGEDMDAERIILTHFSQRYAKIPEVGDSKESLHDTLTPRRQLGSYPAWARCIYAFDLMEIRFKLLETLPSCQSSLRQIFEQANEGEAL